MTQNNAAPFKAVLEATHIDIAINKKTIIHDLSLAIPEGKITAIIGPNGCGKSTTLKAIARILPCAKGSISFLGKDIHSLSHREFARCLAILTQSPVAPTDLTVQDLVEMGRFPHRSFLGRGDKDDAARRLGIGADQYDVDEPPPFAHAERRRASARLDSDGAGAKTAGAAAR